MGITLNTVLGGHVATQKPLKAIDTNASIPGFPTDMQAQTMALLALSEEVASLRKTCLRAALCLPPSCSVWGADITIEGHHAIVRGADGLKNAGKVAGSSRRCGTVMAGLVAEGETTVSAIHHIDRG